jgi:cytochrome c oxidase cbb3-type subunit 1
MQGLMWRSYDSMGFLEYSFVESVMAMHPFYIIRALGGVLFLVGSLIMVYNIYKTIQGEYAHASRSGEKEVAPC